MIFKVGITAKRTQVYILGICCFFLSFALFGQSQKEVLNNLADGLDAVKDSKPRTSVYIRTSKGIYETEEDLWFKSYILDDTYLEPSKLDSVLYVQLSSIKTDSVVWEEKYRIKNGFSAGHIFLDAGLKDGNYYLKAFTKHSFSDDSQEVTSVRRVKIVENLQSLLQKSIVEDSTTSVSPEKVLLSFYPEGGYLINGLEGIVAFKANDKKGMPQNVSGTLFENGRPLIKIKTAYYGSGMGRFGFVPDSSKKYHVELDGYDEVYRLPEIIDKGITFQKLITADTTKVSFKIRGNIGDSNIYIRAQSKGRTMAMAAAVLKDSVTITIPTKDFPAGICEFTLYDNELRPRAERLAFLNAHKKLNISTELSKESFKTREKVTLKIKTVDATNTPVRANLVLSVYDRAYQDVSDSKNIMTHYGLSTQLNGRIYNPANYFNLKNRKRALGLDLLLLTNGWRRYVWNAENLKLRKPYQGLTEGIAGRVQTIRRNRNAQEQFMVGVVSPSNKGKSDYAMLDKDKAFHLGPKALENGNHFYIKHFGNKDHTVAVYVTDGFDAIKKTSSNVVNYPLNYSVNEHEKPISDFKLKGGVDLDEVIVQGKKSRVFRDKYLGGLDSLVKLDINTDYVCNHKDPYSGFYYLNCPGHLNDPDNRPPVEGEEYAKYVGFKWLNGGTHFTIDGRSYEVYKYPVYTEKDLLDKFNLLRVKGFYNAKEFYRPDYEDFDDPYPDYRNTLAWSPNIFTDENGEATVSFYCSDINGYFLGIVEGIGDYGTLGVHNFGFLVEKKKP